MNAKCIVSKALGHEAAEIRLEVDRADLQVDEAGTMRAEVSCIPSTVTVVDALSAIYSADGYNTDFLRSIAARVGDHYIGHASIINCEQAAMAEIHNKWRLRGILGLGNLCTVY
jgi:hypothetical protein